MKERSLLGVALMISSQLGFTSMSICIKLSGVEFPLFEIVFFRSIVAAIIIGALIIKNGMSYGFKNKKLLCIRCLSGSLGMIFSYYAITKIGIANSITLLNTFPLFVALLAPIFIKEKTTIKLLFWILLAFIGVIFIVKPDQHIFRNIALLALASGLFSGIAHISIRQLHLTDHFLSIAFYYALFTTLISIPVMIPSFKMPSYTGWMVLTGAGIFGAIAQLLITYAYKWSQANFIAPLSNTSVLFAFIFEWIIWNSVPDIKTVIGATLIVISVSIISYMQTKKRFEKY